MVKISNGNRQEKNMRINKRIVAVGIMLTILSGCGKSEKVSLEPITIKPYERVVYETTDVMQGDLTPVFSMLLMPEVEQLVSYKPQKDEMEVANVYVKAGDAVYPGDVLVTFKSGEIAEKVKQHQAELEEMRLLVEHYEKLMKVDSNIDYKDDIKQLKKDMQVTSMYIAEENAKLESYSIKAEGAGVVITVSDLLYYGVVNSNDDVLTIQYGDGNYYARTTNDYEFEVGKVYQANSIAANVSIDPETQEISVTNDTMSSYEMELVAIDDDDGQKTLHFKPYKADGPLNISSLELVIEKERMENVMYLPKNCVFTVDEKNYVFLLQEDGFRKGVEVQVGDIVDDNIVIKSGISVGDKVVISNE